jgi:hypothetical protein
LFTLAIQSDEFAKAIAKMMPVRLGKIIKCILVEIEASRGHRVQERFPKMRARFVHERDPSLLASGKRVAKTSSEFQSCGTAADYDNFVKL